jgi:hypothetical protein
MPFSSRFRDTLRPLSSIAAVAVGALTLTSCEGSRSHVDGPNGASAFGHYVAIGTGLSMGVQSGGVLYESQVEAWPALFAHAAGAGFAFVVTDTIVTGINRFAIPMFRAPGCQPPLVAPLQLEVYLSGVSTASIDSSCAGTLSALAPPLNNLALQGATAWAALNLTPRMVLNPTASYGPGDRARYPLVLGSAQSQVTAMRIEGASIVSVELGLTEVLGAATSGLLVAATSYAQAPAYTYVPASVFATVFSAIADSVKATGAKAVLLSVPKVSTLYSLRPAAELWNDRVELATFGINVTADCGSSANLVFTATLVPSLAAAYAATGTMQTLSCADVPGSADAILTPADVATLDAVVTQMNAQIQQVASQNGWAFADLAGVYPPPISARPVYRVADQLTCAYPYGSSISLDGVFPNAAGQAAIAGAVASAIDAKYGFSIAVGGSAPTGVLAPRLCP